MQKIVLTAQKHPMTPEQLAAHLRNRTRGSVHAHRNTKRLRTRAAQRRQALRDQR